MLFPFLFVLSLTSHNLLSLNLSISVIAYSTFTSYYINWSYIKKGILLALLPE